MQQQVHNIGSWYSRDADHTANINKRLRPFDVQIDNDRNGILRFIASKEASKNKNFCAIVTDISYSNNKRYTSYNKLF